MELTTAALAAELCGVEADDELLSVLCAAAEQAWKNRLQSGVTPADCGSALPCAAAFTAAADYLGKRSRVESMTVGEVTVRGLSAASAKELAEALEQSAERLMEPYAVSGRFCFQGVRGENGHRLGGPLPVELHRNGGGPAGGHSGVAENAVPGADQPGVLRGR